jgi:hypothetical protein
MICVGLYRCFHTFAADNLKTNMKKLLATAILALISAGAFAQTSKGSVVLSGSVGYNSSTQDNDATPESSKKTFTLLPSLGFMVQDGLELGLSGGYTYTTSTYSLMMGWNEYYNTDQASSIYAIKPYLKKYFMVSEKVAFTGSAQVGYSFGNLTIMEQNNFGEVEIKVTGFNVALVPGITFFPTEKIGINANFGSLGYTEMKVGDSKNSDFGFNLNGSTLNIGFSYHFNR